LGVGAALVAHGLDNRVHTLEDLRKVPTAGLLATIPRVTLEGAGAAGGLGLISHTRPRSPSAEAYRMLRTKLEFLRRERQVQVLLITSSVCGEGKTTTASNLAISLAVAGRKVLLVDANLRRPAVDRVYGPRCDVGLAQVLGGRVTRRQVVQPTPIDGLEFIAAGGEIDHPADLLMSPRMPAFFEHVRQSYDFVIVDSSPLLP
jgi:succinoglycan biosynthesis transport protein ExoP